LSEHYPEWYNNYIGPLAQAISTRNVDEIAKRHRAAIDLLERGELNADDAHALKLCLVYHDFCQAIAFRDAALMVDSYSMLQAELGEPDSGKISSRFKRNICLQAAIIADSKGIHALGIDVFRQMMADIPPDELQPEQLYFATNFAFLHGLTDVLTQAVEPFLTSREHQDPDYLWHRLHVMIRILEGTVTEANVIRLLELLQFEPYLREVEVFFWPKLVELGIVTDNLWEQMEARSMEIRGKPARIDASH